ncbi:MAG: (2Fe-2S) ferredoxin domain-containing protein [Magnetococcus sp. MYC-9]
MNTTILVCIKDRVGSGPSCAQGGGVQLADSLAKEFAAQGIAVPVEPLTCFGRCHEGPNMRIAPGGAFFTHMTQERLGEVVQATKAALLAAEAK